MNKTTPSRSGRGRLGIFLLPLAVVASAATASAADERCVAVELYVRDNDAACAKAEAELQRFVKSRNGVQLRIYNLDKPGKHVAQYERILKYFRVKDANVPVAYSCRCLLANITDPRRLRQQVEATLSINVFVRAGCPHCAAAKTFFSRIQPRYPGFRVTYYDVNADPSALKRMEKLATRYKRKAASLPAIHFCNSLSIGYIDDDTTGRRLEATLKYWTLPCPVAKPKSAPPKRDDAPPRDTAGVTAAPGIDFAAVEPAGGDGPAGGECRADDDSQRPASPGLLPDSPLPPDDGPLAPGPPPGDDAPPRPPAPLAANTEGEERSPPPYETDQDSIRVPVFGKLSLSQLGMPAFTFLIGLVDGFNPCAMWVLLFLLSVLINLKSRAKILAVAGTFVVISGVAYFAFMAAWLTMFRLIAFEEQVQITLGVFAILIGAIHIKDFFAFKKGISLSIPESVKPGIYARVRRIVTAQNLLGAIAGATVLAALVNIIELLCTAGLPALYTNILHMQKYPEWKNYAYLGLYILAYMLDDSLMVGIVVVTLGRHKLQERGGRWLKLVSGAAIALLGVVMLFRPEWLV